MQETENDILKRVRKIEIKTRGLSNEDVYKRQVYLQHRLQKVISTV